MEMKNTVSHFLKRVKFDSEETPKALENQLRITY